MLEEVEMGKMMPAVIGGIAGLIAVVACASLVQAAAPPVYTCPLCGATFGSLADLQSHFDNEHPGEPIDIIWE